MLLTIYAFSSAESIYTILVQAGESGLTYINVSDNCMDCTELFPKYRKT